MGREVSWMRPQSGLCGRTKSRLANDFLETLNRCGIPTPSIAVKMSQSYKHLYLPIEEAPRELNARLLLLMAAVQAGYRVIIGQQWLLVHNLGVLQPGVVFFKGSNKVQANWMQHAVRYGHKVVAIDEEVTAIAARRFVLKEVTPGALPNIDLFFMQGQNQFDIYAEAFPEHRAKFAVTGNPRFDLLRPEFTKAFQGDADAYRNKYGKYLLINTNFGYVNTVWGEPENFVEVCERVGYAYRTDPDDKKYFEDFFELEKRNMEAFQEMIRALRDRFHEHQIILRPHPAENLSTWEQALAGEERIHVVFEGSAVPWMLGADYFIHNTCTTGTEAMVLGVPVGAYAAYTNWVESIFLSNLVTPVYRDMDSLFQAVEDSLDDPKGAVARIREEKGDVLRQHLSGLDQDFATSGICKGIAKVAPEATGGSVFLNRKGLKYGMKRTAYQRKKIDLTPNELNERLTNLVKATGLRINAQVEKIGDSLFLFTPLE